MAYFGVAHFDPLHHKHTYSQQIILKLVLKIYILCNAMNDYPDINEKTEAQIG